MKYETAIKVLEKEAKIENIGIGRLLGNIRAVGNFGYSDRVCEAYKVYKTTTDSQTANYY